MNPWKLWSKNEENAKRKRFRQQLAGLHRTCQDASRRCREALRSNLPNEWRTPCFVCLYLRACSFLSKVRENELVSRNCRVSRSKEDLAVPRQSDIRSGGQWAGRRKKKQRSAGHVHPNPITTIKLNILKCYGQFEYVKFITSSMCVAPYR